MPDVAISIAMASHNGRRHLTEQLASFTRQTLPPHELVVVDDCSSDATVEILEAFAAEASFPVRVFTNDERLGHGESFLRAFALTTGDAVAFSDQDDVWHEQKLARCKTAFEAPDVVLVHHSGRVVDALLRPVGVRTPDVGHDVVVDSADVPVWFVTHGFALVVSGALRGVLASYGRPQALHRADVRPMDHDEWACLVAPALGSVAALSEELVFYRRHGENVSVVDAARARPWRQRVRRDDLGVRPPRLGGSQGWRGLFDVAEKGAGYVRLAARCVEAAEYLEGLADGLGESRSDVQQSRARGRAELLRHAADIQQRRARAIGAPRLRARLREVAGLVSNGGYAAREKGGLGPAALALDIAVAIGRNR